MFDALIRFGDVYSLKPRLDFDKFYEGLNLFQDKWVQYNPRKDILRKGLSITSLDGGMSGIPDLDSIKEYSIKNNIKLEESDFNKRTEFYPYVESILHPFKKYLGRTHIIKHAPGGQFPPHRDDFRLEIKSCRLFLPIEDCNPPLNYFILDNKILNFVHGQLYFLNTCKEHTVFTTLGHTMFMVVNITINEESVKTILENIAVN